MPEYLPRLLDPLLGELLADHPAVLVVGPRACGKTTTGRRHCRERLRLDPPAEAAGVPTDPGPHVRPGRARTRARFVTTAGPRPARVGRSGRTPGTARSAGYPRLRGAGAARRGSWSG